MDVLFLFEALDQSALANISKAYGGIFAVVQMFHLLNGSSWRYDFGLRFAPAGPDINGYLIRAYLQGHTKVVRCSVMCDANQRNFHEFGGRFKTLLQRHVLVENVRFGARRIFCLRHTAAFARFCPQQCQPLGVEVGCPKFTDHLVQRGGIGTVDRFFVKHHRFNSNA